MYINIQYFPSKASSLSTLIHQHKIQGNTLSILYWAYDDSFAAKV